MAVTVSYGLLLPGCGLSWVELCWRWLCVCFVVGGCEVAIGVGCWFVVGDSHGGGKLLLP